MRVSISSPSPPSPLPLLFLHPPRLLLFCLCLVAFVFCSFTEALSCRPRPGGTPVPLGVFLVRREGYPNMELPIRLALNYIHNHSCVLDGYKLELMYKDTKCKTSNGMKALFDLIAMNPRPVAIFGGVCTEVNEPVAMALKHWDIVQLSYAETHAKFSSIDSSELFPTFYRIVPGDRNLNSAKFRLINHFKWKKIGTVKQSDDTRYALPHETLTTQLDNSYNVKIAYTAGVSLQERENIARELAVLKERDVHIIIMDASPNMSATVLCEAFHNQMYGDKYVWIIPGDHNTNWVSKYDVNCTQEQMMKVLEGHFITQFSLTRKDNLTRIVGEKRAFAIWEELNKESPDNLFRGYLYDGLWTLANALPQALEDDATVNPYKMHNALDSTSFEGVTGRVRFVNNERLGLIDIMQWRNGVYVDVGTFDGAADTFTINEENLGSWKPPPASTVIEERGEYISFPLFIFMSFLAHVGILLSLIFLAINIHYRNHRFIKMSSPNLNNIIIIGSILTFASVVLIGLDTRSMSKDAFEVLCYIKSWTLCLGFTLAFGSMFSKTWRVHSIFTNIRMDKKAIKDSKLLLILAGLLAIDVVVLFLWAVASPFHYVSTPLPRITQDDKVIIPMSEQCESSHSGIFQAILYVIKGVLMILGCFLAWETRHVNVPALNDSKFIGISVYVVVVMSVLGLSTSVILKERVNESYALSSFFIIFSTSCTLCLVFGPKVKELSQNPQGNEPRAYRRGLMKSVVAKTSQTSSQGHSSDAEREAITKLEAENQVKKRCLHQKSTQLWDLLDKLREMGDTQFLQQEWCFASLAVAAGGGGGTGAVTAAGGGGGVSTGSANNSHTDREPLLGMRAGLRGREEISHTSSGFDTGGQIEWSFVEQDEPSTLL